MGKLWSPIELFRRWSVVVHSVYSVTMRSIVTLRSGDGSRPLSDSYLRSDDLCTSSWCRQHAALIGLVVSHGSSLHVIFVCGLAWSVMQLLFCFSGFILPSTTALIVLSNVVCFPFCLSYFVCIWITRNDKKWRHVEGKVSDDVIFE